MTYLYTWKCDVVELCVEEIERVKHADEYSVTNHEHMVFIQTQGRAEMPMNNYTGIKILNKIQDMVANKGQHELLYRMSVRTHCVHGAAVCAYTLRTEIGGVNITGSK